MAAQFPPFDVNPKLHPQQFRMGVQRVVNMASHATDEQLEEGRLWYPKVHEATREDASSSGLSLRQGAGIVAAVSPNMDWERNNMHVMGELSNLNRSDWSMIEASYSQPRVVKEDGSTKAARRIPEVSDMLREKVPSASAATDGGLMKAHRIMEGEDFEDVLNPRTGPKTNRFARNIFNPSDGRFVTIDGRQADIIADRRLPWAYNRGISSAALPSGTETRYEDHEEVMRSSASVLGKRSRFKGFNAVDIQAITWVTGKAVERSGLTAKGQPRKQGAARTGQSYWSY